MTRQKQIAPQEPVELKLTDTERKAVLGSTYVMDPRLQKRLRDAAPKHSACYTLDELEELHGNLACDANHTVDRKYQKLLDKVLQKIDSLLQNHVEQPQLAAIAVATCKGAPTTDTPMIDGSDQVPRDFRRVYLELVSLTDEFCNERLDVEYQQLCREMAIAVCQPGSPVARGKRASWACGIVFTVGQINFLSDPSFEPHVPASEIAQWFGVSTATMHSKAKIIRNGLDIVPFDPDFTLPSQLDQNPLVWLVDVQGFLVDARQASREFQVIAHARGLIPYVPADKGDDSEPYEVVQQRVRSSRRDQRSTSPSAAVAYQIKITLDGAKPPIWRRVRVPDCTLDVLHDVIQIAMGWQNCHLHEFRAGDQRFHMQASEEFAEPEDLGRPETDVRLSELVREGHNELNYWYDFGDDWWHTIKIEKTLDKPTDNLQLACLAGARACPPDDVGGLYGFAEFLAAIADPKHERHQELLEWHGEPFDPVYFDRDEVNLLLQA